MSTAYHPQTDGQSERTIHTLEDMLRACVIDFGKVWVNHFPLVEFSYQSYHASINGSPTFEAFMVESVVSPVCWTEVGEAQILGPELIQETTEKIVQIKQGCKAAVIGKSATTDLKLEADGFPVIEKVRDVAYNLELPEELSRVHNTFHVAFDPLCDALSMIFGLSELKLEEHLQCYILEPEHPGDLVPVVDEAPIEAYITEMRVGSAHPPIIHYFLSGIPLLLPIPLPAPSTSRRADIPEADTPPWKRLLLTALRPVCEVGESSAAVRQPGPTMACRVDCSSVDTVETRKDRAAVRAEIEVLRRERLAYEQESMENRLALAKSAALQRALEARISC
ncbi:putative reverse transcriptase domain-containing protein [Tanacetum coccineum]